MTCHDHDFMNRIVSRIIEVAHQSLTTYSGNYDFYLREREIRREQLLASFRRQQEMLAKEEDFIARFAARASHASQVQSRIKKIEKIERIELPPEQRVASFEFAEPPRAGDDVARFNGLGKVWCSGDGSVKSVFGGASGGIQRQDKIAVVGVNGAGKSTFLKVLAGQTEPTTGSFTPGANVFPGYFSQHAMDLLDPDKNRSGNRAGRHPHGKYRHRQKPLRHLFVSGGCSRETGQVSLRRREEQARAGNPSCAASQSADP